MTYVYYNLSISPSITQIYVEITESGSEMENQNVGWLRWDECLGNCSHCECVEHTGYVGNTLKIYFEEELSQDDKNILDQIVEDNTPSGA